MSNEQLLTIIISIIPLEGCPRTRKIIVYEKLNLYKSIVYKQDFLKKFYSRTAS